MKKILFIFCTCLAFSNSGGPSRVPTKTICEIQKRPAAYNGKIITIRAWVDLDWESLEAWDENCEQEAIMLAYPDDPNLQPKPLFSLQKDGQYERFREAITAKQYQAKSVQPDAINSPDDPTLATPLYRVQATITGRFDSGAIRDKNGRLVHMTTFGHMNQYNYRFIIRSVTDVVSMPRNSAKSFPSN